MIKPALSSYQFDSPDSWGSIPAGHLIFDEINLQLEQWMPRFFGYHALKIGPLSAAFDHKACAIKRKHRVNSTPGNVDIRAELDDLPFQEHSVDMCLLSHVLPFSPDPHHLLREANRVLIPNGYMVVTSYNPFSLAGLNRFIPIRRKKSPWHARFFSAGRVKDWLNLMGYEILDDIRCMPSFLTSNTTPGKVTSAWHSLANKYLTPFGSIYIIVAKKRVLPLTPIKPKWRIAPGFSPVKVSPMNRNS
ncbi:class I SAM-dependent methyltransferase [Thalassotalea agarivorans]|uniref:Methyltransferase domain-containing protein n=1 Tax=Thalassotalea agarivorans TaxID=349064 RepID=A0A1I0C176_THASX|nr:class I SAM-dependent methyltransferase [Thalassotalea agarivorans]SET12502.1 Methyltransferase domain-containing protein [Thalassotalea agarivorans]